MSESACGVADKKACKVTKGFPLDDWRAYLRYHYVSSVSRSLSKRDSLDRESFSYEAELLRRRVSAAALRDENDLIERTAPSTASARPSSRSGSGVRAPVVERKPLVTLHAFLSATPHADSLIKRSRATRTRAAGRERRDAAAADLSKYSDQTNLGAALIRPARSIRW